MKVSHIRVYGSQLILLQVFFDFRENRFKYDYFQKCKGKKKVKVTNGRVRYYIYI